jgi:hypothetical protein
MSTIQATKRAVRLATIAIALVAFGPAAYSQQPSASAMVTAKELVAVTGATALFTPLIAGVVEQAKILFLQQDPSLGADLNEIAAKMRTDLTPRLKEVTDEVAKLYAGHFSEPELKELLVFYKSPLGKKVLSQQPIVVNDSMKFAQTWANKLSEEVVAKMRADLRKKGHNL